MHRKKRLLVISDMHCGHLSGITHPDYQWENDSETAWRKKQCEYQKWAWKTFMSYVDEFRPYNGLIVLGDCIDGTGKKKSSNEHLTTDRDEQVDMAVAAIQSIGIKKISMVRGTPFHTGMGERWENRIAKQVKAEIGNHIYLTVNGTVISCKHFVGGSQAPASKATGIAKEQVSNDQWMRDYEEHPKANIFLRGHRHRSIILDEPQTLSMVCPGLQGGTNYGSLQCAMPVHFGIIVLDIDKEGNWQWYRRTATLGFPVHKIQW